MTASAGMGPRFGEDAGVGAPAGEEASTASAGMGPRFGEEAGDGADLVALLPHRPPFLFVDSVQACSPGASCTARYLVKGDESFLAGHFPDNPVVPAVIQLEALAQVGAIALLADPRYAGRLPLFGGVEKARFRRIVRPGDEMALDVTIERLGSRGGWGVARAAVGGASVCDARIFFTFAPGS